MSGALRDQTDSRPVLVTGGAGFIGANLAWRLAAEGTSVVLLDSLARPGVERNVDWLRQEHGNRIRLVRGDVRDSALVRELAGGASAVFHFAAQVAVTTSLDDPMDDFTVNLGGTLQVIEALRANPVPLIYSSTNKVYGDLADIDLVQGPRGWHPRETRFEQRGISEERPLAFHTPYGCSKGGADQYVLDCARSFDIPTAVLRMSCIYGPRQMGTEDQGWLAHFLIEALKGRPITIFGDGYQVRDVLFIDDAIDAYLAVWRGIDRVRGTAFNLGGGPSNAVSLRMVLDEIERMTGREIDLRFRDWRAGDQRYFVSDTGRLHRELGFEPKVGWRDGLRRLATWLADAHADKRELDTAEVHR